MGDGRRSRWHHLPSSQPEENKIERPATQGRGAARGRRRAASNTNKGNRGHDGVTQTTNKLGFQKQIQRHPPRIRDNKQAHSASKLPPDRTILVYTALGSNTKQTPTAAQPKELGSRRCTRMSLLSQSSERSPNDLPHNNDTKTPITKRLTKVHRWPR